MAEVSSLYELVGGFDVILAVTRRWHELCLQDPVAAHPFERGLHPRHNERLAAYLAEALNGPKLYTGGYGDESHVQRIHAGNGLHIELDEACLVLFDRAIADAGISGEAAKRFSDYFRRATEAMRIYSSGNNVPDELPINLA
jgi:hemoglobin